VKRTKGLRLVFLALLLALAGRLYYVQILCEDELTAAACSQQMIPVLRENSKGVIYDRNMVPLTGADKAYYYLIHKDNLTEGAQQLFTRLEAEPAGQKGEDYLVYHTEQYSPGASFVLQKQWKAYGFCVDVRYGKHQLAEPLMLDLDVMYEDLLQREEPSFYFLGNAAGNLLKGSGVKQSSKAGSSKTGAAALITTLDAELQQDIEEILEDADATGCAVVTYAETGQILSMAGRGGEAAPNLAVEEAYPMGVLYGLVLNAAGFLHLKPQEAAALLGLGTPVFDGYPGEDAGVLSGKNTTATTVQISRFLTTLANQGEILPLTLVMSMAKAESVPCMEVTGDAAEKWTVLQEQLTQKPLVGDGWAAGYSGNYVVIVHLKKGNPENIYDLIVNRL